MSLVSYFLSWNEFVCEIHLFTFIFPTFITAHKLSQVGVKNETFPFLLVLFNLNKSLTRQLEACGQIKPLCGPGITRENHLWEALGVSALASLSPWSTEQE